MWQPPARILYLVGILSALASVPAKLTADEPTFHTRNYHPFTTIFGRPETFAAHTLPKGAWEVRLTTNIVSHTEPAAAGFEALELDGETYHLGLNIDQDLPGLRRC